MIFAEIIKSGADPIVNVYDDSIQKSREMKLSELVKMMSGAPTIMDNSDTKKLKGKADRGARIKKIVKNGKVFHLIENKDTKTSH